MLFVGLVFTVSKNNFEKSQSSLSKIQTGIDNLMSALTELICSHGAVDQILSFSCVKTIQDARSGYRKILTESARKLNAQSSQLGGCIEKARPYYEARRLAKEVHSDSMVFKNANLGGNFLASV